MAGWFKGWWYRPSGDEYICRLTAAGNPLQPGFARWKCTPSAYGTSPRESVSRDFQVALLPYKSRSLATPEGEVLAMLCLEVLMRPKAERRAKFSLRGKWCVSTKRGAFQAPARAVCLFSSGRSPVVWFSLRCCHKLTLTPLPSIHSPTTKWEGRWWRQPPKGGLLPTGSIKHSLLNQPALWAEPIGQCAST